MTSNRTPDKVAVVTGASSGIGAATARALDLFPALDLHSRAVGLAAGWAERGALTQPERLQVAQLTGCLPE